MCLSDNALQILPDSFLKLGTFLEHIFCFFNLCLFHNLLVQIKCWNLDLWLKLCVHLPIGQAGHINRRGITPLLSAPAHDALLVGDPAVPLTMVLQVQIRHVALVVRETAREALGDFE